MINVHCILINIRYNRNNSHYCYYLMRRNSRNKNTQSILSINDIARLLINTIEARRSNSIVMRYLLTELRAI